MHQQLWGLELAPQQRPPEDAPQGERLPPGSAIFYPPPGGKRNSSYLSTQSCHPKLMILLISHEFFIVNFYFHFPFLFIVLSLKNAEKSGQKVT